MIFTSFREAIVRDIPAIQSIRNSVAENLINDPLLISDERCADFLENKGKGWICEVDGYPVGFAIADLQGKSVWALFVRPEFENRGIGKKLHTLMLNWYFSQSNEHLWLSTEESSRAELFYCLNGWTSVGMPNEQMVEFKMTRENWASQSSDLPHESLLEEIL
ncbi:MAG: GNAT family N-acetyltransferase [Flavobacteriales bacterium]